MAKNIGSPSFEHVENDYVIMNQPPLVTLESSIVAPSRPTEVRTSTSMPLHFDTTSPILASATKSLRAIMKFQHRTLLVNTYDIHFAQYSNERKKKVTHIILHVVCKKVYAICTLVSLIMTYCMIWHWNSVFEIVWKKSRLEGQTRMRVECILAKKINYGTIEANGWTCK